MLTFLATQKPFTSSFTLLMPIISPALNGTEVLNVATNPLSVLSICTILTGERICLNTFQVCKYSGTQIYESILTVLISNAKTSVAFLARKLTWSIAT